ncbi:MAG: F0F1 ATP synthase subunit A [Anaerolineae bacterium]|nr:F0F1 ATP synthase subunit A [Anaerolineae bacterium]MBT7781771.1 F0F1 ATP synthase subunit A [Anaerolineae bacterium]
MSEQKPKNKVWARWVVLGAILLGAFLFTGFFGIGLNIKPIMPEVFLPGEVLSDKPLFGIEGFFMTNTFVGMIGADIAVFLIALGVYRGVKSGKMALSGVSGAVEALLEALQNMTEGTAGKWTKVIFPWFATITLLVLSANWLGLLPGVETIGLIHEGHGEYAVRDLGSIGGMKIQTIWDESGEEAHMEEASTDAHAEETHAEEDAHHAGASVVPFFRPVSTDLNFTFALALVAVVMVQVVGFRALGWSYLTKFWNTKHFFDKPIFGFIDFGVGLLELVSELSKVLSFAFRLFGNLFAGAVLIFVMGSLVPFFVPAMFYMLELFVGMIQAIVFGMLTMTFMAQATQSHGDHDEAHA